MKPKSYPQAGRRKREKANEKKAYSPERRLWSKYVINVKGKSL
jgi:hypothetical protein